MKTPCVYCGNNQVPHRFYWYSESLNILLTGPRQKFLYNPLMDYFARLGLTERVEKFFLWLGEFLGAVKYCDDLKLCKIRRAQVLWEEAEKRGIKMKELVIFGKPVDTYVAEKDLRFKTGDLRAGQDKNLKSGILNLESKILFNGLPRPEGYVNKWLDLMDDKWQLKQEFQKHSLPVPMGASCSNFNQAKKIFEQIQKSEIRSTKSDLSAEALAKEETNSKSEIIKIKPVIVKPRAGSRGRHNTTFIHTEADLKKAFYVAKQLCYWVMVEEQLFGPVYRATIINGHLAGVLRGDPPAVTGDGKSSIADLIRIKNNLPHPGVKDIAADKSCEVFLSRQNLLLSSVLEQGRAVNLTEKIGVNYGGSSSEDFEICHPDNKELFLRAARVLGDPIVGFDYIIPDIAKSYKEQRTGFIEVNSLPFINLHHDPLHGAPRNAAAFVWNMLGW